ncbi:MAG: diguanylate cyclase [Acidobacteria bacterium]|nr:diguanylate cyclase [Acidobacteriota bacterium]
MSLHWWQERDTIADGPMYLAILTASGLVSVALARMAWRNRRQPGFAHFAAMELATAWWIVCYLGEQLDPLRAPMWFALKFPAIGAISPAWLLFTLHQMGEGPRSRAAWFAYLWPALLLPIVWTNDQHRLFFAEVVQREELRVVNGPLFPLHLALSYTFFLVAAALLLRDWRRRGSVRSGLLFLGGLIPFAGNVLNELGKAAPAVGHYVTYNPTLPGFAFGAVFIGWAALRYQLLDPRPLARDALFDSMPEAVVVLNENDVIVDLNGSAAEMLGRPERDVLSLPWAEVFRAPEWRAIPHGPENTVEREWTRGPTPKWLEIQRNNLWDARGHSIGLLIVARDVTSRKHFEQELRAQSYRDRLTGLSNRRYFDDEAARLQASREFPVAVFAFDLDGLKQVNDRDGHAAGDMLLQAMASFLAQFFRAGDRVIRQGGDEFVVLLPSTSADEAERIRTRMAAALAQFNSDRTLPLRFSTGVSVVAKAGDWASAMKRADERLYEGKREASAVPV